MLRDIFLRRRGWNNNNVLWASHYVSARPGPRVREFSGNPITVSWHLGQNIERNINEISFRPLSFIFAAITREDRGRGWAHISEFWEMVLLVFWQSSGGQEQCHLMFLESHSARKERVSLNGNFSKETWDVPSRKLSCHLSSLLRILSVPASLATFTRPL